MMALPQATLELAKFEQESISSSSSSSSLSTTTTTLKNLLVSFNESFECNINTWDERCQIAPFILSSLLRLLNRAVSAEDCKIHNIRLALACTECLQRIYDYTEKNLDNNVKAVVFASLTITDDKICNLICNIILLVIAILESLKVEESCQVSSSDFEILSIQSFCFYKLILKCWIYHGNLIQKENTSSSKLSVPQVVTGPCLAQLIQSSLFFSKHANKSLAEEALGALLVTLKYTKYIDDWRSYFPGTFSGLHAICLIGQKRGSNVLSMALECLIALINSIACDRIYQNDSLSEERPESDNYRFNQMRELAIKIGNSNNLNRQDYDNLNLPIIFNSPQMQDWRVDILQRIGKYFPQAFKTVYQALSPKQRVLSLNSLHHLLVNCRSFLGHIDYIQFLLLFAPGFDDNTLLVRQTARAQWLSLKEYDIKTGNWQRTCNSLTEKFVDIIERELKVGHPSLEKDSKVQEFVSTLIGIGDIVGDELNFVVKAGGPQFIKKVIALFLPDLDGGSKAQVLDARQYYVPQTKENAETRAKSFLGSYYRLPWLSTQNDNCKKSIRKLCFIMGRCNALLDVTSLLSGFQSSLENQMKRSFTTDTGVSSKLVDRVLAGWIFVCNGVLGFSSISKIKNCSAPSLMPCSLCNINTIPRRCTRCFQVSYCSKEHQQQHWSQHKEHCAQISRKSKAKSNCENVIVPDDNFDNEKDIFDPEYLMTTPDLMCSISKNSLNYKSLNNIIKAAMLNIKFYIKWTNFHLQSLSTGKNVHSLDLSSILAQAASPDILSTNNFIIRMSLITSTCVECIANCIALVGISFRENLFEIIYNFLELLCDPYHCPILRQAVNTSLLRISLYLQYENLSELLLDVLDSVVDMACNSLRSSYQENISRQESNGDFTIKSGLWRTHLVIDFVLNELGDNIFAEIPINDKKSKITTTFALLSDVVADTLKNIDKLVNLNFVPSDQISAIIRVMLVLVKRSLPKIDIKALRLSFMWSSQSYVLKRLYNSQYLISNTTDEEDTSTDKPNNLILSSISISLSQFKNALAILEKEQLNLKEAFDEEPFDGEHFKNSESAEVEGKTSVDEDTDHDANPTSGMKLILDILERCAYFLAQPKLSDRVLIIETIASSFLRLSFNKRVLYPAVHKIWPAIINRLKEQARIFIATVDIPENSEHKKSKKIENRSSDLMSFGQSVQSKYPNLIVFDQSVEVRHTNDQKNDALLLSTAQSLLLPALLELLMITSAVCDDFLALKFQDDVWPLIQLILRHNVLIDWSNLINYDHSTKHSNNISKFSVSVKLKLSILSFINQVAINPNCSAYVKSNAKVILWFLVPYLSSLQGKDVVELATVVMKSVFRLEPTFGYMLIYSIIKNQVSFWDDIANDPCINDILDRNVCTTETILRYYRKDLGLLSRLTEIIELNETKNELMEIVNTDRKWHTTYLKNWSTI